MKEIDNIDSHLFTTIRKTFRGAFSPTVLLLVLATTIYIVFWSYISISKFLALNSYVFDLGISAERGWQILHVAHAPYWYFLNVVNSGIVFPLSPLTASGNYYVMLVFQTFAIAVAGPALYKISMKKGLGTKFSFLVSIIFFLYFPVYGIFWFDFHYQVFFLPLFIIGYLFYLEEKYTPALILLLLSGMVRYPYSIFPLAFGLLECLILFREGRLVSKSRKLRMLLALVLVMAIWTILGFLSMGILNSIAIYPTSQFAISNEGILPRLFAIFIMLLPLLFLPILSPRWIVLAFPAFFLILTSNNAAYTYHLILQGQYVAGIVPFLILGFVDAIAYLKKKWLKEHSDQIHVRNRIKKHGTFTLIVVSLILLILLNSEFAPMGPFNQASTDNFNFSSNISYNSTQTQILSSIISLIPANTPYVAYQNNLPQILPRPLPLGYVILMGGYLGNLQPFNISDATNNSWPVMTENGDIGMVPIDYAIGYANNQNFYHTPQSTYNLLQTMYDSGNYGILAENDGFILLEYNYTGQIQNYAPIHMVFPAGDLLNESGPSSIGKPIAKTNDQSDGFMFYGPGTYLFPGTYNVTFVLKTTNTSSANNIWLQVTSNSGNTFISFEHINGSWFSTANRWQDFNLSFNVTTITGMVEFRGFGIQWNGTISLDDVVVTQK